MYDEVQSCDSGAPCMRLIDVYIYIANQFVKEEHSMQYEQEDPEGDKLTLIMYVCGY